MSERTILVTGFEPFTPHKVNPTEELARSVEGVRVGGAVVRAAILPVHHADAAPRVLALLEALHPVVVLHLGLAGGRARITRYDTESGTLEARVPPAAAFVRVRTAANDALTTRVQLEGDAPSVLRRFRDALS